MGRSGPGRGKEWVGELRRTCRSQGNDISAPPIAQHEPDRGLGKEGRSRGRGGGTIQGHLESGVAHRGADDETNVVVANGVSVSGGGERPLPLPELPHQIRPDPGHGLAGAGVHVRIDAQLDALPLVTLDLGRGVEEQIQPVRVVGHDQLGEIDSAGAMVPAGVDHADRNAGPFVEVTIDTNRQGAREHGRGNQGEEGDQGEELMMHRESIGQTSLP